jgi:hypothetical protein
VPAPPVTARLLASVLLQVVEARLEGVLHGKLGGETYQWHCP